MIHSVQNHAVTERIVDWLRAVAHKHIMFIKLLVIYGEISLFLQCEWVLLEVEK